MNANDAQAPRPVRHPTTDSTIDRRTPAAQWALALNEPLLTTAERVRIDADLAAVIHAHTEWASVWFTGIVSEALATLPSRDPWRQLSATLDLDAFHGFDAGSAQTDVPALPMSGAAPGAMCVEAPGLPAPAVTGAVSRIGAFGTWRDHADLIGPPAGRTEEVRAKTMSVDIGYIAVRHDLDPRAAALIGFAGSDAALARQAILEIHSAALVAAERDGLASSSAPDPAQAAAAATLEVCAAAVRAVAKRRSTYVSDDFMMTNAFSWLARAEGVLRGMSNDIEARRMISAHAIEPGAYDSLTGGR